MNNASSYIRQLVRCLCLLAAVSCLSGCGMLFGGVKVESVAETSLAPSQVALYLSITHSRHGVVDLQASHFRLTEGESLLDSDAVDLQLLDKSIASHHEALVLVDMSGKLSDSERETLVSAVTSTISAIRRDQAVLLYAFDGREAPQRLASFRKSDEPLEDDIKALDKFRSEDPSRSLNSAVDKSVGLLSDRLKRNAARIRVGTLLVVTRGPDLAGRVQASDMSKHLAESKHHLVVVALGEELNLEGLNTFNLHSAKSMAGAQAALSNAADSVHRRFGQYYLLSYCSPTRAGTRPLSIKVTVPASSAPELQSGESTSGSYRTEFDASGFRSGCSAEKRPLFNEWNSNSSRSRSSTTPSAADSTPSSSDDAAAPPDLPGY